MTQVEWALDGHYVILANKRYSQGFASSISNNCLIDTLREKLNLIADVSFVRRDMMAMFPGGPTQVTDANFLTLAHHWGAVIDLLFKYDVSGGPKFTQEQFKLICVDIEYAGHGEVVGAGHTALYIARVHANHFIPLTLVPEC